MFSNKTHEYGVPRFGYCPTVTGLTLNRHNKERKTNTYIPTTRISHKV